MCAQKCRGQRSNSAALDVHSCDRAIPEIQKILTSCNKATLLENLSIFKLCNHATIGQRHVWCFLGMDMSIEVRSPRAKRKGCFPIRPRPIYSFYESTNGLLQPGRSNASLESPNIFPAAYSGAASWPSQSGHVPTIGAELPFLASCVVNATHMTEIDCGLIGLKNCSRSAGYQHGSKAGYHARDVSWSCVL